MMLYRAKRSPTTDWQNVLTSEEIRELEAIAAAAQKIDADRQDLTARRQRIVNRACKRARYRERRAS